jgi:hypothetical protein
MTARLALALLASILVVGCSAPAYNVRSQSPSVRCLSQPGRGQDYSESRPLFFLFCAESP